ERDVDPKLVVNGLWWWTGKRWMRQGDTALIAESDEKVIWHMEEPKPPISFESNKVDQIRYFMDQAEKLRDEYRPDDYLLRDDIDDPTFRHSLGGTWEGEKPKSISSIADDPYSRSRPFETLTPMEQRKLYLGDRDIPEDIDIGPWNTAMLGPEPESIDLGSVDHEFGDEPVRSTPQDYGPWDSLIRWHGYPVFCVAVESIAKRMSLLDWNGLADHMKSQLIEDEIKHRGGESGQIPDA
ncbi:hypothetical protein KAR91_65840, partial [Candidatus Pacearchaeota archaeon]|nr:hypothetical protein [Candidatus Pacearchaeota archaeon]